MLRVRAVIIKNDEVLALERHKDGDHFWCFPGGGVEEGESEQEALARECLEETNVRVKVGKKIFGVDYSEKMIKIAEQKYAKENIEYIFGDVNNLPIESNSIDVAWSRCGPTLEKETRIFKKQSVYIQIKIAYQDCLELKELFGRGQDFKKIDIDDTEELKNIYQEHGFKISLAQRYKYVSFYPKEDFISFLQNTPVLVDFDLKKDKELFKKYINKFPTKKGVQLNREKMVLVAER